MMSSSYVRRTLLHDALRFDDSDYASSTNTNSDIEPDVDSSSVLLLHLQLGWAVLRNRLINLIATTTVCIDCSRTLGPLCIQHRPTTTLTSPWCRLGI